MVAHHWFFLIKKIKNNKNKKKTEIKNENKNVEKIKNILFRKTPTKLPWPKSAKSDKKLFYSKKEKKTQNYHDLWVPNLVLSYQALYIMK